MKPLEEMTQDEIRQLLFERGEKQEFPPLKEEADDIDFLEWLENDIWEHHIGSRMLGGHIDRYTYYTERRQLTKPEFRRVKKAIKKLNLIVEPTNACMGFNFGINIYDAPLFPGTPCELKLSLTGHHFDTRFEDTWKKLSPLSHNEKNGAKLIHYGFASLQGKFHYDY